MMTTDEYLDRNIATLQEKARKDRPFGTSYVQRLCRIGYNQACHTIDRAIGKGILVQDEDCERNFRFAS